MEVCVVPKLHHGFGYENDLLGVVEPSKPAYSARETTDGNIALYSCKDIALSSMLTKSSIPLTIRDPKSNYYKADERKTSGGFLREPTLFTVTDSLMVKTCFYRYWGCLFSNLLKFLSVDTEERVVHIQHKEEVIKLFYF